MINNGDFASDFQLSNSCCHLKINYLLNILNVFWDLQRIFNRVDSNGKMLLGKWITIECINENVVEAAYCIKHITLYIYIYILSYMHSIL